MKVACATVAPVIGDPAGNAARVAAAIDAAGADVVVLPELVLSGYGFESAEELLAGEAPAQWSRPGKVVVGGFAERAGDVVFNSAAIVDGSGVRAVYRKVHLWDREPRWFEAGGEEPPVVETEHGRVSVVVCHDLFFPEWIRVAALRGAELLCIPGNWPAPEAGEARQPLRASVAAEANGMPIALCDRHDAERGLRFAGASCIAAADGTLHGRVADVGRGRRDPLALRRPELYGRLAGG